MRFDLPLLPVPSADWQSQWDTLMQSDWLRRKLDRARRLHEHQEYAGAWLADEFRQPLGLVIDIGPGAGELLEIARAAGHDTLGIDAPSGAGGMGNQYLGACRLMHERQQLTVEYTPLLSWLPRHSGDHYGRCVAINSRGSIEQVFHAYMDGPPHDVDQCAATKSWCQTNATECAIAAFCRHAWRLLRSGGVLTIHCNGAKNHAWFAETAQREADATGLRLVGDDDSRMFKWRKP